MDTVESKIVWRNGEYRIERWVTSYAYARNGNVHNPTPKYRWTLFMGKTPIGSCNKFTPLRVEALGIINNGE